jgi:chromosome segregation ATPase
VSHEISQLKEEIDAKEAALTKEHFDLKQAEKKAEELQKQTVKYAQEHKKKEERIKSLQNEISKLQFIINESEKQRKDLKEKNESIISERDILGTQLIRKNDELALLYEKIKIQQSTLAKGETQYRERLNDIEHLRNKIKDQYYTLRVARKQADMIPELKNEIHNLQKELIEEKLKVRGLSDELENPMNVHRWRKLEGTDSDTYEMITKIQTLQKRLIAKTEECVEKDVIIEQKEKALNELREMMNRQPSIEDVKMIGDYQQMIKQKTRQMKAMAAELNFFQHQTNEYKSEVDRLTRDVQESKRKYFEIKKREQLAREQIDKAQKAMQMQINLPDKRFVGGGFNLAV